MRNLCSITSNQAAIIALFRVVNGYIGNLAPMPGVSELSRFSEDVGCEMVCGWACHPARAGRPYVSTELHERARTRFWLVPLNL
ncbi:hypothetical protein BST65_24700 [Bradyrhizobium canariense]|nr:hypothetical protein BST65_24700 [Bradyrhizobium canariense]OSI28126.1 hypothetical protein BST66_30375 [Bradyrhizobium canariense]OSI46125.1 hypothetical protein BSZ20_10920 [Bradyrhizobium canariense]OSI48444.1 hypothetical protein BSZ15_38070 [Bradyrhizobium canariense]OSI53482.1 hypothetical protein BST67_08640 [Bradyrhizobium canariense]